MPLPFNKQLDLKLIDLVKDNPILYNTKHIKYLDFDTREVVWQKIGDTLNRPAAAFGGIQCQIHFGDFQEEKHKPGFIENPNEYLPEQYSKSWGIEKKILKEYKKHQGLSQLDAKYLYTKTARDLPTYGVTFFLVKEKEKKGKKKLVPRLLGINAESILRLDEVTKEILQVWPLTHVKTYHVGKGETFTLNFGDYSDKEYSVKTRDAFAIRDILQGYIDLIRKRMLRQYANPGDDGMIITQETVHADRGHVIEHIAHGAGKIVEHSFVGPTKLIPYEQGAEPMRGTQIMTVQQIVVADQANNQQRAIKGEVPMRTDMSMDFVKKLNRLNSNSVKIVTLLTDPDDLQTKDAQKIVNSIEQDMPIIVKGVQETVEKQSSEADKKKLLDKLQELMDAVKSLSSNTRPGYVNPSEAQDAAKKIADLSTQMYFSMDPKSRRRSQLLKMSRKSFIIEDQTDARLRRPSFIAAATTALHTVDNALRDLQDKQGYTGPPVDADTLEQLEKGEVDKIGKLSAAVALYLTAHADPKNIDYAAAVNSMNTINEIMPELVKDAQAIGSTMEEKERKEFLDDILALCNATKKVCTLTGTEDHEKMQEASNDYADFSGKLIFTLGRGANADKENEIIELSKQVGDKTSVLLVRANELTALAPHELEAEAGAVDAAGVRAAIAARDLLACAQLTAPAIHEPHCQSALTAAAETLSSSAQQLAVSWKPLVEDPSRQALGEQLQVHTLDLAKALDRLKNSYGNLSGDDQTSSKEKKKVKFAMSLCEANDDLKVAEEELNKPYTSASVKGAPAEDVEKRLSDRMAQLNAAIAALLAATADRENPDYETAELAVHTIKELMPEVVKDTKAVSAGKDEATRAAMLQQVRALCEASRGICTSVGQPQAAELGEAVAKFVDASGKLVYVVNPRAKPAKEQEIMALSSAACGEASKVLAGVQQLASSVGGEGGAELDARGAHTADAAQALLTAAQVTAPSMDSPRCQSALVAAADKLSQSAQQLRAAWQPLQLPAALQPHRDQLEQDLHRLDAQLNKLRAACHTDDADGRGVIKEQEHLKFINGIPKITDALQTAEQELNKPIHSAPVKGVKAEELENKLSDRMAQLNAAIAALLAATSDKNNPDFVKAEQAAKTISELVPDVVKDTKAVSAGKDEATRAAMLQQVRALCEASRGICTSVGQPQAAELGEAVAKFADASGKLVYVVNPRAKPAKEQEIMGLSARVCGKTSQVLSGVQQLADSVRGEGGAELDARGALTADAAQALLATAQVTAPSMDSPRCQSALVAAADKLSQSAQQLRAAWQPLQLPAALQPHRQQLEGDVQALEADIVQLRAACSSDGGKGEKDRLKLVSTLSKAKDSLQVAEKELNKPITPVRGKVTNPEELEHKLSDRMAQLNAAIAALIAATSDKEKPDYAQAEQAIKTISELMPDVVKDTKAVSAGKDEATRAAMLQQVRALCEASRGICTSVGQPQAAELGEAVAKFADASGKLVYVVNPRAKPAKEQEIMALSSAACGEASKVLAGVQQLASSVGGEGGAELDARGAHTADAAQALLTAAQVTAPSMDSPRCQSALVAAADKLSQSAQQLRAAWQPLQLSAALQPHRDQLEQDLHRLDAQLNKLRAACHTDDADGRGVIKEQERLKFINGIPKITDALQTAEQELNKPIHSAPVKGVKAEELENKLSDRMAQLNAAIAALLAATSDKNNPDFVKAEQAAKTISELVPDVVKDTKAVSAGKDEATRAAMLQQVRALCEASRGICTSVGQPQAAELGEAVAKFADASGKLVYVVNPRAKPAKEQEIMGLSARVCGKTSQVLSGVQQLADSVRGEGGAELDARGALTADAAQALLATAQVTAPSMDSPRCQSALVAAADKLSQSAQQLRAAWQPLQLPAALQPHRQQLEGDVQALEADIVQLRVACSSDGGKGEKDRLKLVSTLSKAKDSLQVAEKELNKPITPVRGKVTNPEELEHKLSDRMAQLNAAIAALIAATSDKEKPDYAQAEQAVKTISELMPDVVKDTKAVSAGKDEATRAAMLQQVRALCEASRGICTSVGQPQAAELGEAVAKFADASGKLMYVVNPRAKPAKEQEIMALSSAACGEASKLLAGVQQLASSVGGEGGAELDARGAHTADAAQALLTAAQVTAPSMDSPRCQSALVAAADKLSQSAQQLRTAWQPLQLPAALQPHRKQLEQDLQHLDAQLNKLRAACHSDDSDGRGANKEQERLKFINSMSKIKDNLQSAEQELNKPIHSAPVKGVKPEDLENKLSDRMAQLNAAIAALLAATNDKDSPDFVKAEQAAKTISDLLPDVVKDTKAVSAGKDEATRAAMLQQVRALCEASRGICTSVGQPQAAELGEAVAKFADASGKLVYVVNPRAKPAKEQEIMGLSARVCGKTSQVLSGVQQLADSVRGEGGAELDARGALTADAAQALLATAQVTAPSMDSPRCQSALVAAADKLSQSAQQLRAAWQPLQLPAALQPHRQQLEGDVQALEADIVQLRAACSSDDSKGEKDRLKLVSTLSKAKDNLKSAEQELNKPLTAPVKGTKPEDLQNKLADKMAQLNAAIASLISATSDRENPNYVQAEQAVKTITDLMPEVVKDTKAVSAGKDEATRAAMLQQVRALCEASRGICTSVGQPQAAELGEAVAKFSEASGKLNDVVSPRANRDKEQRIMNASASVCAAASQLLTGVQHVAGGLADQAGHQLDRRGTTTADAAQALLTCAQVTAPSMDSPRCQSALVAAADKLSQSAQQLRAAWQPLQLPAALQPHRQQLEGDLQALENELEKLRAECLSHDKRPPAPATPAKPRPPVPVRKGGEPASKRTSAFAQEFLDQMRTDEAMSQGAAKDTCTRKTDDEKILHQLFVQSLDDADKDIRHAEDVLRQVYNSQVSMTKGPAISPGEVTVKQRELEDKLAAAGVEVANLVSANYADNIDCKTASKSTKVLPQLMNSIAEDAKILQHNLINAEARKAFMNDMLGLCQASRKLCDSAKNNREKLNDAAVEFGDKSAKLLHEVSTDVDPFVEKEIISRAKAIGDSASRLALESAELASSAAGAGPGGDGCARNICEAGASCVDAAGKLVYTSKLVSPSIHNSTCQEALISSAENLSTKLKAFTESWKPLASDPNNKRVKELATGASELEALLEQLRKDVKGDLGKHRIEKLVVEDTPLRQFTMKILEDAKSRAERTDIPAERRREYAHYANKLADAVRALDLTNSRCLRAPHDTNKRRELEYAIQNLQAIVLQERPKRSDKDPGKIVDLLDFVKDVSNEAEKLTEVASSMDLPRGKQTVADIKDQCHKINLKAFRLLEPEPSPAKADHTMLDDILEVDQFGQECDNRVEQISSLINNLEGEKAGPVLKEQAISLTETCNLLRFAAKSAVSTTQSASLEETLNDLDDLENSVIKVLIPECGARNTDPMKSPLLPPRAPPPWAVCRVAGSAAAAARGQPALLAPALTAYVADAAARTDLSEPAHRDQLLHHLHKLVDLIKSLTVCTSKRVATWQPVDGPEVAAITEQILQELENPESIFGGGSKRPPMKRLVSAGDVSRVLSPSDTYKFDGDQKQLSHKLQQLSTQLSSMCSTVVVSADKPESLARSLHAAADVAVQLAAVARATTQHIHNNNDPIQSKRVEEAAQEMSYSTYNLLKTAEFVSHDPHNPDSRRKLLDACRGLTDSINKLVRVTSPGNKVQRECGELTRSLQLQQGVLQGKPQPQCALPYADCVLALQSQHDVIQKLKSEEKMPREEFLQSLNYVTSAVCNSTEYAAQCAYLIAISDSDKDTAKEGLVDVPQIQKAIGSVQDSCMKIIRSGHPDQTKEEKPKLQNRVQELVRALEEAHAKAKDGDVKLKLTKSKDSINKSANALCRALDQNSTKEQVSPLAMDMLDILNRARAAANHPALLPVAPPAELPPDTKDKCEQLLNNSKSLLTKTQALIKEVSKTTPEDEDEMMTWVMYNTSRNNVLDVFDALLKSIKTNGHRAGILEIDPSELEEGQKKSFVETQVDIANKWLKRASCKADVKAAGEEATKNVIEIANKMCEELNGSEKEEMSLLVSETEQLLSECSNKYDNEKYSVLMDRLREMRKMIERGVVTRVVEDFMEGEEPLADLDILADAERDEAKRKFLLERKIAELLAQLGRVTTTARLVAHSGRAGPLSQDLHKCSEQTELLAPMLVKAAQQRIDSPNDKAVVDNYKALLAKYAESLSKVRELCDQAVDPMDFVQTAGETMQRMREESTQHNDPQKCAYTSTAITKLANRVIQVSMSSSSARSDPELQRALSEAQKKLTAATPGPNVRASRLPDWRDTTAEILRTTGEVESVLGGENIFNKQADADQPIYNAALSLHSAVRGWSSRDNDIVGSARKCAVHMARLADYMNTDRKHELLVSSKSIVAESHEVALLARRLAHECTDHRIKTNLLQSCERIPTISGQLKMLTTVKGSSLGHQGSEEDKEAMNMLVGNAENLMLSIQEVVKAAASASVKIASQRGPRMRWVRKNYY